MDIHRIKPEAIPARITLGVTSLLTLGWLNVTTTMIMMVATTALVVACIDVVVVYNTVKRLYSNI